MEVATILKFLHIGSMFMAVGVSVGLEIMAHRVANTGDVRAIRTFFAQAEPVGTTIPILFMTGLAFGLLAAWTGAFNMLAPWLLMAYALFALTLALHMTVGARWFGGMGRLSAGAPDGAPTGELATLIHDPAARALQWYTLAMVITFVFIMVVKPFS
jgi:Predicted integral membrane protein (DUF2269)